MTGKFLAAAIVISALIAGVSIYYLQVYGYYYSVDATGPEDVMLVPVSGGDPQPIPFTDFQAINGDSSPIRYRACFTTSLGMDDLAAYAPYPFAIPRNAPGWFDCFDATSIGAALDNGTAKAFLSVENIAYGIDRIAAITNDGRGFVWHEINSCGKEVFDGKPVPEGCPTPPDR
ncbi:MAG: DUF6446 family protein [Pseudooceanicola sp.]